MDEILATARTAYDARAWGDAYDHLSAAAQERLGADDLERLAMAAYLTGRIDTAADTFEQLHRVLLEDGETRRAVRWILWLALILFQSGRHGQGGGWLSRAERLLDEAGLDVAERGFLLVPTVLQALDTGDGQRAYQSAQQVAEIADRHADPDLTVMGALGLGQSLVAMGEVERGIAKLDEAMVAVTTGEVLPLMTGIAYCAMIVSCRDVFDLRRAQEWTVVLSRWCSAQQDLRPFRGQCLVHRSEIMQLKGEWSEALEEVEDACRHLDHPPGDPVMGMARYQQAELLRLRGQFARAEQSYRQASEWGHPPQPGLALLRLAQGRIDAAVAAIRREVDEAGDDRVRRSRVLAASVEILLAAGDVAGAGAAVDELASVAEAHDSLYLDAAAAEGQGGFLLVTGEPAGAFAALRRAWRAWQELQAPYDAARVRLSIARACRELDDHDTADMEVDAARRVFEQLGAAPALARALELSRRPATTPPGGLTPREVEVLRLVATGATNREVADTLVISEKTVARHLSNMFTKLGLASRAAATAWAYEHDLA